MILICNFVFDDADYCTINSGSIQMNFYKYFNLYKIVQNWSLSSI